jgi:signal transduction histidine kinase
MSLKAVLTAAVGVLGALSLAAAALLVILTTYLHRTADSLGEAVEGVRIAEELEVDLLSMHRLSLFPARDAGSPARSQAAVESDIRTHLLMARRMARLPAEQALLSEVERAVSTYFLTREQTLGLPPEQAIREVEPRLEEASQALERLIAFNVEEARAAQAQAARWDSVANVGGIGAALLLVLGGTGLLLWLRRYAFRPLLEISRAMQRFGSGRKRTRAPEAGPTELREMARTFNDMANSLARQQDQQLTFLAGVAHDLRNPLSALKMSAALISSGRPMSEERLRKAMALVSRQVARLDRMVGDLLDATRIEAGRFELQLAERDLREVAREVVELYLAGGSSHELQLALPEQPVLVRCDAARMEQVMHNLVSNALKYSPVGSRVDVRVEQAGEEALLSVVDRGIGISAEEMRGLFAPFRRAGKAREVAPGVGIGLSVSRRIVEAHGGRIEVESRPGAGSTFRVRIPLARAARAPEPRPGEPAPGGTVH